MDNQPVIVEATYNQPKNEVWKALTNNDELKKWYFQLEDFKPEVGFKFQFTGGPDDGPQYLHLCQITQVVVEQKLAYTWRYDGFPGNSEITWELFDDSHGCRLRLTHTGLESFTKNGKDFSKESFNGGWNYFVNDALKNYLEAKK